AVRGPPLMQVPAGPPPSLPGTATPTEAVLTLRRAGARPSLLVTAPVTSATDREPTTVGTVIAGRRLDGLGPLLQRLPSRPSVVFLAGDRALAGTPRRPAPGGARAVEARGAGSPDGALWVVLPVREFARAERRLGLEFLALLGGGVVVLAGVALAFLPAPTPPHTGSRVDGSARAALERRNRELEALNAISATIGRGADLATTAEETLEGVRRLA